MKVSYILIISIFISLILSCNKGQNTNLGDGKKLVFGNVWIAKTSEKDYMLIDKDGMGIVYGNLLACEITENGHLAIEYFSYDEKINKNVILDTSGRRVSDPLFNPNSMKKIAKFYKDLE